LGKRKDSLLPKKNAHRTKKANGRRGNENVDHKTTRGGAKLPEDEKGAGLENRVL